MTEGKKTTSPDKASANTQTSAEGAPQDVSERKLIETAAANAPTGKSTTTQKAMDVIAAADIQREAITRSFNEKKAQITQAVKQQKETAVQQVTAAKKSYIASGPSIINADAQKASDNLAKMAQAASSPSSSEHPTEATKHPETGTAMNTTQPSTKTAEQPAPPSANPEYQGPEYTIAESTPGTILPKTVSDNSASSVQSAPPPPQPQQSANAQPAAAPAQPAIPPTQPTMPHTAGPSADSPIAQEVALTIRSIIAQEIEKQLQALLTVYTNNANGQDTQKPQ